MTAKFICNANKKYEIYVFQSNGILKDRKAIKKLFNERYRVFTGGGKKKPRPIVCTAVNVNDQSNEEKSVYDELDNTYHFVLIDKKNDEILYAVSCKLDDEFGFPLENRYNPGNYPLGPSCDLFRKNLDLRFGQSVEFYRHIRTINLSANNKKNLTLRALLYAGVNHFFRNLPKKYGKKPISIWIFDAKEDYARLYGYAGAWFRELYTKYTVFIPINRSLYQKKLIHSNGFARNAIELKKVLFPKLKNDLIVSRPLTVLHPGKNGAPPHYKKNIDVIDGFVDVEKIANAIIKYPYFLHQQKTRFNILMRATLGVSLYDIYQKLDSKHQNENINLLKKMDVYPINMCNK